MKKTLEILIPTYNRRDFLDKTLGHLAKEIRSLGQAERPSLLISDNGSTDGTDTFLESFQKANKNLKIRLILKEDNEGMEANFATVLGETSSDYMLFLSDDDKLADGYLKFVIDSIQSENAPGVFIPGMEVVETDGRIRAPRRTFTFGIKRFEASRKSASYLSHFFHQMSGLVFLNDRRMVSQYLKSDHRNVYPFIFLGSWCVLSSGAILAPRYKTIVLEGNTKDWNYPKDGFICATLANFRMLDSLPYLVRSKFEIDFLRYQGFRLKAIQGLRIPKMIQFVFSLKGPTTLTKIFMVFLVLKKKVMLL
ncbi:glycosyltransferase [Akkermansiaceae bacterium]|nr:glycosyltransferase [Akkermansiaceae bacterium]